MATRLSKAKKLTGTLEADLHCHVFSNPREPANVRYREAMPLIGNPKTKSKRGLEAITYQMKQTKLDILGLTRAEDDWLPERIASQAADLPKDWKWYADPKMLQVINPQGRIFTFIPGEELFTPEGHVLIPIGLSFGEQLQHDKITFRKIRTYANAHKDITLVSDHPFSHGGLIAKGKISFGEILETINAYEYNASVSQKENSKTERLCERRRAPLTHNSDAHRIKDIGKTSTRFKEIYAKNGDELAKSLNNALRTRGGVEKGNTNPLPLTGRFHHFYMVLTDHKLGASKHDSERDDFNPKKALEKIS